nr:hypothetical protein [Tanacetum cinerariifolium]
MLASCGESFGQESIKPVPPVRPEILTLVSKIAADNMLKSAGVGYGGVRTDQWERYETLNKDATDVELEILSNNSNAVVRCYSFQALASRRPNVFSIILQHLTDTTKVNTFMGCIISSEKVGDYFIDVGCYKLTENQRTALDSILITDSTIKVDRKNQLLAAIKPDPKFYQHIRQQAEAGNPQATLALARFGKESDINIIEKLFSGSKINSYYAIYSTREFPSSTFYPYLAKVFKNEWNKSHYDYSKWRILYQAIA